ncbi:MAG: HAD hydrolase-like protein, partial [Gammaproteobacteria bacterium]|nr:HAD hydrolase-like protein [Gammaproteobacteria bacterium]
PNDNCNCRKPKPGLLEDLARAHSLDLRAGYYVGDSLKDLVAAESVSCSGVLVLTGKGHETRLVRPKHELTFDDLLSFARYLLTL